jgi:hypothetical protein
MDKATRMTLDTAEAFRELGAHATREQYVTAIQNVLTAHGYGPPTTDEGWRKLRSIALAAWKCRAAWSLVDEDTALSLLGPDTGTRHGFLGGALQLVTE